MKLKEGVDISNLHPKMELVLKVLDALFQLWFNQEMVVTAGRDGKHMEGSLHYEGRAVDIRTKTLTNRDKMRVLAGVLWVLPVEFEYVLESVNKPQEHLHIEYDPVFEDFIKSR